MGSTSGSQESVKRGKKRPYCRFALPKTRDLDPSSYLPKSFSRHSGESGSRIALWDASTRARVEARAAQSVSGGGSGGSGPPPRPYNHLRVGPGVLPHGLHYGSPGLIRTRYSREVLSSLSRS